MDAYVRFSTLRAAFHTKNEMLLIARRPIPRTAMANGLINISSKGRVVLLAGRYSLGFILARLVAVSAILQYF